MVSASIGPFGIVAAVVLVPDDGGDVRAPKPASGPPEHRVLVSRDGRTWADASVAELAGRPVRGVLHTAVVGDRPTVAVSVKGDDPTRSEQVVLVGTPG